MKVWGFTTSTDSPPRVILRVRLFPSDFQAAGPPGDDDDASWASTRESTSAKPMLWGVRSYLGPGLPRPMTIRTAYFLSFFDSSFLSSLGATPGAAGAPAGAAAPSAAGAAAVGAA